MAEETLHLEIGKLLLDTENPRHEPVESRREPYRRGIATERQKLVVLADDSAESRLRVAARWARSRL